MNFTLLGLIVLGLFFIYLGWAERTIAKSRQEDTKGVQARFRETVASIFTVVGAGEYALAFTLFFVFGALGPYSFFLGLAVSLFAITLYVPLMRKIVYTSDKYITLVNGYRNFTTPDYFYWRYESNICSFFSTCIVVLAFTAILWVQFIVGGEIISAIASIRYEIAVLLIGILVATYLTVGGFSALLHTDVYQGLFMWGALIVTLLYIFFFREPSEGLVEALTNSSSISTQSVSLSTLLADPTLITIFIATVAAAFAGPDIWQRLSMAPDAENPGDTKRTAWIAGGAMILFALPMTFLALDGLAVVGNIADPNQAILEYLRSVTGPDSGFFWPDFIRVSFAVGLLSAFVSTADTAGALVSTSIQNEWFRRKPRTEKTAIHLEEKQTNYIIWAIVVVGVLCAILIKDPTNAFTGVLAILSAQGLPVFLSFHGFGSKTTCAFALVLGSILALFITFYDGGALNGSWWLLLPILPGLVCLFARTPIKEA